MRTALYRHFARDGQLLYVGISDEFLRRSSAHASVSEWFGDVTYTTIEWFETRADALRAETKAIILEAPHKNVHQSVRPRCNAVHPKLLQTIEQFCAEHGMPVTNFGKLALGDNGFVRGLRNGRDPNSRTVEKVMAFMANYDCEAAQ